MITAKELFEIIKSDKKPPRIPFVPTLFEHAARVINKTPSEVAQNEDLLVKSQLACYEKYKHDLVSVGVDIYNSIYLLLFLHLWKIYFLI